MRDTRRLPHGFYTSAHVSAVTGATLRQLQWWDEEGLFPNRISIHGHSRGWMIDEVMEVRMVVDMRNRQMSLQCVRKVIQYFRKIRQDFEARYLLVADSKAQLAHSAEEAVKLMLKLRTNAILIEVPDAKTLSQKPKAAA